MGPLESPDRRASKNSKQDRDRQGELPRRGERALIFITVALAALFLVAHYTAVWVYLAPMNPIKLRTAKYVGQYITPLFAQDWRLFAPTPINIDELLEMRVMWHAAGPHGKTWKSEWIDITTPVHQALHKSRIGPYSKLSRPYTGIVQTLGYTDELAEEVRRETLRRTFEVIASAPDAEPDTTALLEAIDSLTAPTPAEFQQRRLGREMAYRLATSAALRLLEESSVGGELEAINVRFALRYYPRFSQRNNPTATWETRYIGPLGWERPRTNTWR